MRRSDNMILLFALLAAVWLPSGCRSFEPIPKDEQTAQQPSPSSPAPYAGFVPIRITILPLTRVVCTQQTTRGCQLSVYVSILDGPGNQIKAPGRFRIELYERISRSSQPRGKRIILWPDMELSDPGQNQRYWRDFLRAYEFKLDFDPAQTSEYIIEVTFTYPDGRRLNSQYSLNL